MNIGEATVRYEQQRDAAARRGIEWQFTFEGWSRVWSESGKWSERGTGAGRFVMARHGDVGPYAPDNVAIILATQNTADAHTNGRFPIRSVQRIADFAFDRAPDAAPREHIDTLASFRIAVRSAWRHKRVETLTMRSLAELIGAYPAHVSDYLIDDDAPGRRDLPAAQIPAFEWVCGNTIVTQWLVSRSPLTIVDPSNASRLAA